MRSGFKKLPRLKEMVILMLFKGSTAAKHKYGHAPQVRQHISHIETSMRERGIRLHVVIHKDTEMTLAPGMHLKLTNHKKMYSWQ